MVFGMSCETIALEALSNPILCHDFQVKWSEVVACAPRLPEIASALGGHTQPLHQVGQL
jgi:hypothetical protein